MKTTAIAIAADEQIPAEIRQVIVRQLGAALAEAWRRQHNHVITNNIIQDQRVMPSVEAHGLKTRTPRPRDQRDRGASRASVPRV